MYKIVGTQGWLAYSKSRFADLIRRVLRQRLHNPHCVGPGGDAVTVFEALMFAIAFATLVITILSFNHKK